jgi:hypothetical protein
MISNVSSSFVASAAGAKAGVAKIAALNKQACVLRQQLIQAQKRGPAAAEGTRSDTIAQQIVSVQFQIEQLILEAQLSKLGAQAGAAEPASSGRSSVEKKSTAKPASTQAVSGREPYQAAKATGKYLNVRA